jgi:hypothetical protein
MSFFGETHLTVLDSGGPDHLTLGAGALVIVPQGVWHRDNAPEGVTVLYMTPTDGNERRLTERPIPADWQADHVLAHGRGGEASCENYLPAHKLCNTYRWDYLPEEFQMNTPGNNRRIRSPR